MAKEKQKRPPVPGDQALSDPVIRKLLGDISQPTVKRYREKHGMPGPTFRIGQTAYTWRSEIDAWLAKRSADFHLDGKKVRRPAAADDFREAS